MRSCVTVFDCDGVIVDSRDAVFKAYVEAGVTPPDDFWGKPVTEWMPNTPEGVKAHRVKNEIYVSMIRDGEVPLLTGGHALRWLQGRIPTIIMTSASKAAVNAIVDHYSLRPTRIHYGMTGHDRWAMAQAWKDISVRPIVIDDQPSRRGDFPTGIAFIDYVSTMTRDELLVEVFRWTL
jgi:hypothetical protein